MDSHRFLVHRDAETSRTPRAAWRKRTAALPSWLPEGCGEAPHGGAGEAPHSQTKEMLQLIWIYLDPSGSIWILLGERNLLLYGQLFQSWTGTINSNRPRKLHFQHSPVKKRSASTKKSVSKPKHDETFIWLLAMLCIDRNPDIGNGIPITSWSRWCNNVGILAGYIWLCCMSHIIFSFWWTTLAYSPKLL